MMFIYILLRFHGFNLFASLSLISKGTGNVLKIQKMLHYCNEHLDGEKEDDTFQAFAVLGIAMISMGEDIGADMALRSFNHLVSKKFAPNI